MPEDTKHARNQAAYLPEALGLVSDALRRLRYGAIQLTVHDGRVMQIDVTERKRLGD
jgi:hypothetical protein